MRLHFTLGELEAKERDPEATSLFLDLDGNVTEGRGANFFIVSDGQLRTSTNRNVLQGVSRQVVLELAHRLGIPAVKEDFQPYDVFNAQEAFFTSTPYCLIPVTKFNGMPIRDGKPGPVTQQLMAAWSEMVGVDFVQQALSRLSPGERAALT
jgi:branched-chain amino acid aminotransferase